MAKVSQEQWAEIRKKREISGVSYRALAQEYGISDAAIIKRAKREGWKSGVAENTTSEKVSTKPEKVSMNDGANFQSANFDVLERDKKTDTDKLGILSQLTDMQEVFVREYMTDFNATQAAIRAGYSAKSAGEIGYQLLQKTPVRDAIASLFMARAKRLGIDGDELIRQWSAIVSLDANEISQLSRVCCPYCWGEDHHRQYTPAGLEAAQKKHDKERAQRLKYNADDDIGDFPDYTDVWYDKRKAPHDDCPECHGEGIEEVFFNDTRNLSPAARLAYCGVKEGKDGIEVLMLSKEKAMESLAKARGLFREQDIEVNIAMMPRDELFHRYDEKMRQARERQVAVLAERGIVIENKPET